MKLVSSKKEDLALAMEIIDGAKKHLRSQNIDQWQAGYPDEAAILGDAESARGYFVMENELVLGYLCIDFAGEPAYDDLNGQWLRDKPYVVVHRLAFHENARGKHMADAVFRLVEELSLSKNIDYFRIDTDGDNKQMQHILQKNGFTFRGTICFDNSEKWGFDKEITR